MAKKHQSKKKIRLELNRSMKDMEPIHIRRTVERHEREYGVVLGVNDDWVLIASIRDGAYLDGYRVFRVGQLRHVASVKTFESLLHKQDWWPLSIPASVDLTNPRTIIESAAELCTTVMVFEEVIRPGMCLIGVPVRWRKKSFGLHNIDAKAQWDSFITKIAFKDVTQVAFKTDYAKALLQVVGDAPPIAAGE